MKMFYQKLIDNLEDVAEEAKIQRVDALEQIMILKELKAGHHKIASEMLDNMDTDPREQLIKMLDNKTRLKLGYE